MSPTVSPGQLLRFLLVAIAGIQVVSLVANVVGRVWRLQPFPRFDWFLAFVDVDLEGNLPSWFSTALLLSTAAVLWHAGASQARRRGPYARHWKLLAVIFAFLSLDEAAQVHEAGNALGDTVEMAGAVDRSWVLLAMPLTVVFALAYLGFLRHLPTRTRWLVAVAGTVFVVGAVGMELAGAWLGIAHEGAASLGYLLVVAGEETMEMVGVSIFLYAVARHLQHQPDRSVPAPAVVPRPRSAVGPRPRSGVGTLADATTPATGTMRPGRT
ncbi:hypothetical protein [Micromonospora sp. NBC_01813]|uniref:hypothetical protein n=1 Tax=Micromonospora sp. NBC_01813 TaxID=2975988 RepID=UPI002DD7AEC1|nr:hypothetical protein [Micromonospora sp. NBC_01813]WSA10953.1 hypothetical protein OG958_09330 [Micromonospora sp. NBC_01813]